MKLREYMDKVEIGAEITCWDSVIDTEFYVYKKNPLAKPEPDFEYIDKLEDFFAEHVEIEEISQGGITLGLYNYLDDPEIIQFAKDELFAEWQYESDEDVVELFFDDIVLNYRNGYPELSKTFYNGLSAIEEKRKAPLIEQLNKAEQKKKELNPKPEFALNDLGESLIAKMQDIHQKEIKSLGANNGTSMCEKHIHTLEDAAAWYLYTYDKFVMSILDEQLSYDVKGIENFGSWGHKISDIKSFITDNCMEKPPVKEAVKTNKEEPEL